MYRSNHLNQEYDYSKEFINTENSYYMATTITNFSPETATGNIKWDAYRRKKRFSFNQIEFPFAREEKQWIFPKAYVTEPDAFIKLDFINTRTVRVRISTREEEFTDEPSLMIENLPTNTPKEAGWEILPQENGVHYQSAHGKLEVEFNPWKLTLKDENGDVLTSTQNIHETTSLKNDTPIPFSFINRAEDRRNLVAASFTLSPDEKIFGTGESFTRLNKRGQTINLFTKDAMGTLSKDMYKPIPFFMSSNGYGMFVHTSAPLTIDFGETYDANNVIYSADESFDAFMFIGSPKEILSEYTAITGRPEMPPLWSFGNWMSRISYFSEEEVRGVAKKLEEYRIPADVIHIDTGWFEEDWRCNYKFSETRFNDPEKMIKDLNEQGLKVSLWQIPYFTPENELYPEIVENGYAVTALQGGLPTEDAILDYSNPEAVAWYQQKIADLLDIGVSAIKVDFGEAAPIDGIYASGKGGLYEHNLYPLRYNKAVHDVTKEKTGENIIWARSAWAGSQRYPLHWGGDAEITNNAMAASLRSGLSLGLSGFSFWSHDIGGFTRESPKELYSRWLGFGMLSSHSRMHGEPPKEPWEYDEEFTNLFRSFSELRYSLMPYIYSQGYISAQNGWPMIRTLFFEEPNDPTGWLVENQYLFGSDLLVAPLIEEKRSREVYVPSGVYIDYQTNERYEGNRWYTIESGDLPVILLVKEGSIIPHIESKLTTQDMDWSNIELRGFGLNEESSCEFVNPLNNEVRGIITVDKTDAGYVVDASAIKEDITFNLIDQTK